MGRVSQNLEWRALQAAIPGEREDPASLSVRVQGRAQSLEQERGVRGWERPLGSRAQMLSFCFLNILLRPVRDCREPAREIPPMASSCRTRGNPWAIRHMTRSCGRVLMSKASGLDGPPGPARASTPEPESVCLPILCLSPALLTLAGGCP